MTHKKKVTSMCLSADGRYLICGDAAGLLYIWTVSSLGGGPSDTVTNKDDNGPSLPLRTLELHGKKGVVTNLLPLNRPLSLFGLTANLKEYDPGQIVPLQKVMATSDTGMTNADLTYCQLGQLQQQEENVYF